MVEQAYYLSIMNRLPIEKRAQIINALVEGNSIRATCRLTDHVWSMMELLSLMGNSCAAAA